MSEMVGNFTKNPPESHFINKTFLESGYVPRGVSSLLHREREINILMTQLNPAMRGQVPNNIFIYGKTGTGKSTVTRALTTQLKDEAQDAGSRVMITYINCDTLKTSSAILKELVLQMKVKMGVSCTIGKIENALHSYLKAFCDVVHEYNGVVLIIFDEVDKLRDREILNVLARIKENQMLDQNVCLIGITNDLGFAASLDPRTKSVLSHIELLFHPYNANQLRDILDQRARMALRPGVLNEPVVPLCAAYAAQENGDARKAIELLKFCVEIADETHDPTINESHVKKARDRIEQHMISEAVRSLPVQTKLILASCVFLQNDAQVFHTGQLYEQYKKLGIVAGIESLSQRRVMDILSELEMLGLIKSVVINRGRQGRSREIIMAVSAEMVWKDLMGDSRLVGIELLKGCKKVQTILY